MVGRRGISKRCYVDHAREQTSRHRNGDGLTVYRWRQYQYSVVSNCVIVGGERGNKPDVYGVDTEGTCEYFLKNKVIVRTHKGSGVVRIRSNAVSTSSDLCSAVHGGSETLTSQAVFERSQASIHSTERGT